MGNETLISQDNWRKKYHLGVSVFLLLCYLRTISANSSFLRQVNIEPPERKSATLLLYLLMLRIGTE
jgi:hypothetical protein